MLLFKEAKRAGNGGTSTEEDFGSRKKQEIKDEKEE